MWVQVPPTAIVINKRFQLANANPVVRESQMHHTRVSDIVKNVTVPAPMALVVKLEEYSQKVFIQIRQTTTCNRTGLPYNEGGRKWYISEHTTESEIVLTCWKALLTFIEHEARENFLYKGKRILDPHIDVNALLGICEKLDMRK